MIESLGWVGVLIGNEGLNLEGCLTLEGDLPCTDCLDGERV